MKRSPPEPGHRRQANPGARPGPVEADREHDGTDLPAWLLRHRITLPERAPGFFRRAGLAKRCSPTARRLTLLVAPGGFGKTTLLAECCRDILERDLPVAWLALDGEDEPDMLDAYLAHAFRCAGLDILGPLGSGERGPPPPYTRTALLLRAVEAHRGPFVLALDEAERLDNPDLVALLNFLLRAAPANLHIALATRQLPPALDIAAALLESEDSILTADDLRFSRDDTARFFDNALSRRELAAVASTCAGWPIAMRIRRNERRASSDATANVLRDVVDNWIESRLWYSFAHNDREFVLDAGLFDWFDGPLLQDVLADPSAMTRIESMRALDGLLEPVRGDAAKTRRLHPLIRDHCAKRRRREDPARYRAVHEGIARALAARGRTVEAMRHAAEAGDAALLATVLVDAGGVRLCLREGYAHLIAADRLVPDDAIARHPRLGPARCAALAASGRLVEARRLYARVPPSSADADGDDLDLYLDRCLARAIVADFGLESAHSDESRAMLEHATRLAETPAADPAVRNCIEFMLCVYWNMRADFEKAAFHGRRIRALLQGRASGLAPAIDIQFGLMAMARGRVADAVSRYRSGLRLARADFLRTPKLTLKANLLVRELDLERNRLDPTIPAPSVPGDFQDGAGLAAYFSATDLALEPVLADRGPDEALLALDAMRAHPRHADLPAWARHLAALRVSLLADADRVDQATRTWAAAGLPGDDAGCVDLVDQSWRELESLCCARLRLLTAAGGFDAARRLADAVLRVAAERGLTRTAMRVRILAMKLEHRAGADSSALAHLSAYLRLFDGTDYARALVREGDLAAAMLRRYLSSDADPAGRAAAERLLNAANDRGAVPIPRLTDREAEVLLRLHGQRDADIAAELGITRPGVRHHVQNVFRKLAVHTRRDATRRARELGILPPSAD